MDTYGFDDPRPALLTATLLAGAVIVGLLWYRMGRRGWRKSSLPVSRGAGRLTLCGVVAIAFTLGGAWVSRALGPVEYVQAPTGKVSQVVLLPVSGWGLGVARLEVDYRTRGLGGPIFIRYRAYRVRLGCLEYRCVSPEVPQFA